MSNIKKYLKFPKPLSDKKMKSFILNKLSKNKIQSKVSFSPDYKDLYLLYKFIELNKRVSVMEFGSGWSTIVLARALKDNQIRYMRESKNLRHKFKFKMTSYENLKKYYADTKNKIKKSKLKNISLLLSELKKYNFKGRFCTKYKNFKFSYPDFIYLDGPNPLSLGKNSIDMPMAGDLIFYEHFFNPGTIILVDGRTANARFLKANFQRKWIYHHDKKNDQNIFYLNEEPLGKYNKEFLKFYKN